MAKTKYETISIAMGLVIHEGRVLLIKRHEPQQPLLHNNFELPGGKIEKGEQPGHAAVREILEETGVITHIRYPVSFTYKTIRDYGTYKKRVKICCFRCAYVDFYPNKINPEKVKDTCWVAFNDLDPLLLQSISILFLREVLKSEGYPIERMKTFENVWSVELRSFDAKSNRYRGYQILVRAGSVAEENIFYIDHAWGRVVGNYYSQRQSNTLELSTREATLDHLSKVLKIRYDHRYTLLYKSANFPALNIINDFKLYINPQLTLY